MNISITSDQAKLIDKWVNKFDFGNRSEFFRSVIRLINQKPELIIVSSAVPFIEPSTRSRSEIVSSFSKTKRYSKEFLKDLEDGLRDSRYFNKK